MHRIVCLIRYHMKIDDCGTERRDNGELQQNEQHEETSGGTHQLKWYTVTP